MTVSLTPQNLKDRLPFLSKFMSKSGAAVKRKLILRADERDLKILVKMIAMIIYRRIVANPDIERRITLSKKKKILKKKFKSKKAVQSLLNDPEESRSFLLNVSNILEPVTLCYLEKHE